LRIGSFEMTATSDNGVIVLGPGEGKPVMGPDMVLKVGKDAGLDAYTLMEASGFPPGFWVPPHFHEAAAEAWYVLDGELTFMVGDRTIPAGGGSFILVPRGQVHSFGNTGDRPASFLEFFSPPGMESYFEERTALASATSSTGEPDFAGIDPEAHAALARKHGMVFV
jgi:mannose-6-phosphate isomerase-like protein (cupin superfamily)